jgi:hypothetical protein
MHRFPLPPVLRVAAVSVFAFAAAAATASAEEKYCTGNGTPMPQEAVIARLTEAGYTRIRELDMEHGCYEAKGFDKDGRRVEVYVEPATGEIVRVKS